MKQVVWEMPVPSSALTRSPSLSVLIKRQCELSFYMECDDGEEKAGIVFDGVEAYKCTYMSALSVEMINVAYDKLVQIDQSSWLSEVRANRSSFSANRPEATRELHHLMICFDDGPCYEFICSDFNINRNPYANQ